MPRPRKKLMLDFVETDQDRFAALLHPDLLDKGSVKSTQVYGLIRQAIVQLALPPGAAINEKAICERLGISRTPLREAIKLLRDAAYAADFFFLDRLPPYDASLLIPQKGDSDGVQQVLKPEPGRTPGMAPGKPSPA